MDRVYEDLIIQSQIIEQPSNQARQKLESMLKNAQERRPGPKSTPKRTIQALTKTEPPENFGHGITVGSACAEYRTQTKSKNLCYEYCLPKIIGCTPEEVVLFAVALDLENGAVKSPLFQDGSLEVGISVVSTGRCEVIRILVVTNEVKNDAQQLLMM